MELLGGAVRSASRGLSRLVGRRREEEHRPLSIIRKRDAGFGYTDLSELEQTPGRIGHQEKQIPSAILSQRDILVQEKFSKSTRPFPFATMYEGASQKTDIAGKPKPFPRVQSVKSISPPTIQGRLPNSTKGASIVETRAAKQEPVQEEPNKVAILEDLDDEFEVFNNLANIKYAAKTPEDAWSILEKSGPHSRMQPNSKYNPAKLKVAFFYLVGSNCMPNELRIPWYLQIMSSSMIVNKGSEMLMKIRRQNPNSTSGNQEQILKPLRVKEIKETWKRYLLCDIPESVLFKIENAVKFNETYRTSPSSATITSTLIKFYSLWAMVLYKPLQKSMSAICQSRSIPNKPELFVDYAGNKVPIDASALDGLFHGVWMETTTILNADKFAEVRMQALTYNPGTICLGFIDKMISKQPDSKQYQQLLSDRRTEFYRVIDILQKNFFFWEESQFSKPNDSGFMLDLFVLLNGKLVMYLVAKIISGTSLETLKGWADINSISTKLLEECKKLVMQPTFDQVTNLLDFDFIKENIYQMRAKS